MPDHFSSTTTRGYGSRIGGSFKGAVIGFLMFIAAFPLLYWNEGRVDVSDIAKNAVSINASSLSSDTSIEGKLVAATGVLTTEDELGDELFLAPGAYIEYSRNVQVYAWSEEESERTESKLGGSETVTTTYDYTKGWESADSVADSSKFEHPEGHKNVKTEIEDKDGRALNIKIGAYALEPVGLTIRGDNDLALTEENTLPLKKGVDIEEGKYIYVPASKEGSYQSPEIGDVRVSYGIVPSGISGTVFGKMQGTVIAPYKDQKTDTTVYDFTEGDKAAGLDTFHGEYTLVLWLLRALGFVLMWIGLSGLLAPISVLLGFVPFLGTMSRFVIGFATFVAALALALVTIVVSMIAHSLIAVIVAGVVVLGIIVFLMMRRKNKKQTENLRASTPPPAQNS